MRRRRPDGGMGAAAYLARGSSRPLFMPTDQFTAPGAAFRLLGAVFVISKQGIHDRKAAMDHALNADGIAHEFFDATMGADLSPDEFAAVYDAGAAQSHKTIPRKLHVSDIGCCLSHRRLYAEVVRRGLPSALVLEDDAQPVKGRAGNLAASLAELPADWDLLYLGFRGARKPPVFFGLKRRLLLPVARLVRPGKYRLSPAEAKRLYPRPFSKHLLHAGYHQGTHAYAVSLKGAGTLHAHFARIAAPADATIGTLILEGKLKAFALREDVFTTTGAPSQIISALK